MLVLTITEAQQMANENNCNVFALIDKIINQSPMKLSPLTMNTISKEFEFFNNGEKLMAECEYSVEINPNHDSVELIGEVTNYEGDVREIKETLLLAEFRAKHWNEIEAIRDDLKAEKKSPLRDFGARIF